jgi:hypothetical protein
MFDSPIRHETGCPILRALAKGGKTLFTVRGYFSINPQPYSYAGDGSCYPTLDQKRVKDGAPTVLGWVRFERAWMGHPPKLAYDLAFGKTQDPQNLEKLIDGIELIDFSHGNPMWRYYELDQQQRKQHRLEGLVDYLPSSEDGANRDIGALDGSGLMRFGAKHNDIYPIIGDMIRWRLGLPPRLKRESAA